MSELQAGTILVVRERYTCEGNNCLNIGHILYVVSDIKYRKSVDADQDGNFYWCIDMFNPASDKITTWHRTVKKELIDDIAYFHTLIDSK